MKQQMLFNWFPLTIFDWEEVLLGRGDDFYRKHLPNYDDEHWLIDQPASKLIHGALLAGLYAGVNMRMNMSYPMVFTGHKGVEKDGRLVVPSDNECVTSPAEEIYFSEAGPVLRTLSGSRYLLMGEDRAWDVLSYLKEQPERPDLIRRIFSVF